MNAGYCDICHLYTTHTHQVKGSTLTFCKHCSRISEIFGVYNVVKNGPLFYYHQLPKFTNWLDASLYKCQAPE